MSIRSQRIVYLILRGHCLLVCPHKRSLLLSKGWRRSLFNSEKGKKRGQYTWIMDQQGSKRSSWGGQIAESMTSVASRSFNTSFCLVFQKMNATNFRSSSFATKFISLEILFHEILQHENFPIYGIMGLYESILSKYFWIRVSGIPRKSILTMTVSYSNINGCCDC